MKNLKHIKRFNESDENLNISDVSDSEKFGFDQDEIGSTDVLSGLSKDVYKAADEYASLYDPKYKTAYFMRQALQEAQEAIRRGFLDGANWFNININK